MQLLDSDFTNRHTLSKRKSRLDVLVIVCQHITNWSSNTLVPKVLEPNKNDLIFSFIFQIIFIKMQLGEIFIVDDNFYKTNKGPFIVIVTSTIVKTYKGNEWLNHLSST